MAADEDHPVVTGLLALVGVGLAVGLVLGVATMIGTRVVGVDGEAATSEATQQESLYLPTPTDTGGPSGPLITLAPEPGESRASDEGESSDQPSPTTSKSPQEEISLQAGQNEVSPMDRIDLSGVYPGGEGAILQVQRFAGGSWDDFPVTANVSNETFSTYVQTGQTGKNRFRVADTDSGTVSNEVAVTVR